jgi:hypothetical protein
MLIVRAAAGRDGIRRLLCRGGRRDDWVHGHRFVLGQQLAAASEPLTHRLERAPGAVGAIRHVTSVSQAELAEPDRHAENVRPLQGGPTGEESPGASPMFREIVTSLCADRLGWRREVPTDVMTGEHLTGPALRAAWLERALQGDGQDRKSWRTPGVDAIAADKGAPSIDPLSGLHTPEYLFGRVHELDRAARGGEPPSLVLIAVRWTEPSGPWLRIAAVVRIAAALTDLVRPEGTLCQAGTHTALALVPDDGIARRERAALATAMSGDVLTDARLSIELVPVPEQRDELRPLIERLRSRP